MLDRPFFLDKEICLTPITLYTLEQYKEWFNSPHLVEQNLEFPRTEREIQAWILKISRNKKSKYFSILIGGENIGHIGIKNIDRGKRSGELDLFLADPSFFNRAVFREIFSWLQFFARTNLSLRRLYGQRNHGEGEILKRFLTPSGFVEGEEGLSFWIEL